MPAGLVQSVPLDRTALAYSQAHVEPGANPVITTASARWSYAASLPLGVDPAEGPNLAVEARLRVVEGKVGVGVLAADERSFVVEKQVEANDGLGACVVLRLPHPAVVGPLIVRNASESGPSKAVLEEVAICRLAPSSSERDFAAGGASEPTDAELPRLVRSLEYLRPLVPYPGWRFDSDWYNADFSFQTRRRLWEYCRSKNWDIAVDLPWYDGLRIELPLLSDAGRQLFVSGCIDPNELSFLEALLKPEMVFVDVGAHLGLYTLYAAGRAAAVWSFEPSSREFAGLRRNIERNKLSGVHAMQLALGSGDRDAELRVAASMHSGQNTLRSFSHAGVVAERVETVGVRRLDRFADEHNLGRIDVIKVDVEQTEHEVFQGAGEILRSMQPWLLLEVSDATSLSHRTHGVELFELLHSFGYVFHAFDHRTGLLVDAAAGHQAGNLVASPARRPLPDDVMAPRRYYFGNSVGAGL